jgi:hypothetical protein
MAETPVDDPTKEKEKLIRQYRMIAGAIEYTTNILETSSAKLETASDKLQQTHVLSRIKREMVQLESVSAATTEMGKGGALDKDPELPGLQERVKGFEVRLAEESSLPQAEVKDELEDFEGGGK